MKPLRVLPVSDIHLTHHRDGGMSFASEIDSLSPHFDVLVIAGDLAEFKSREKIALSLSLFASHGKPVVFVLGNHEYWGSKASDMAARLRAAGKKLPGNVHVLDRRTVEIEGRRFVGATLWHPEPTQGRRINDDAYIGGLADWRPAAHAADLAFLRSEVREGDIVVTHHLPHHGCIDPRWAGNSLNELFVSPDAGPLVEEAGATVWIHGHSHERCDARIGRTRCVRNPLGYPSEDGRFSPYLVLEV